MPPKWINCKWKKPEGEITPLRQFILKIVWIYLLLPSKILKAKLNYSLEIFCPTSILQHFWPVILAFIAGAVGVMFKKITRTCKEFGEFLTTLGTTLEDQKITLEEHGAIVKEGKDFFAVWGQKKVCVAGNRWENIIHVKDV